MAETNIKQDNYEVVHKRDKKVIKYGMYPMNRLSPGKLPHEIFKILLDCNTKSISKLIENGFEALDEYPFDKNTYYKDVKVDDDIYRLLYIATYRYENKNTPTGIPEMDCRYPQKKSGYNTGRIFVFKWEPIEWNILTENDEYYMLTCSSVIDSQIYRVKSDLEEIEDDTLKELPKIKKAYYESLYNEIFKYCNDDKVFLREGRDGKLFDITEKEFRDGTYFKDIKFLSNSGALSNISFFLNVIAGRNKQISEYSLAKGYYVDGKSKFGGFPLNDPNYQTEENYGFAYFKAHMNKFIMHGNYRPLTTAVAPCIFIKK